MSNGFENCPRHLNLWQELETLSARLEESQNGWGSGQVQLAKVEAAFRRMEREKNEIIQVMIEK